MKVIHWVSGELFTLDLVWAKEEGTGRIVEVLCEQCNFGTIRYFSA